MGSEVKGVSFRAIVRYTITASCLFLIASCGGGGGSPGARNGGTSTTATGGTTTGTTGTTPAGSPAAVNFAKAAPADKSIVIKGAGGNGRTDIALLTFSVVDSSNRAVPNQKVNFSLFGNVPVTLVNASGTTDQNGQVTATISSGSEPTTVRVIATVDGTSISTTSDTVTVTTGLPTQAAFSLSAETFNISGWNHDNEKTKINILMADQSNNPVADGTPVVFQTDSGAVGSSAMGGCLTVNGACSVEFRSQNPRYGVGNPEGKKPGVATITASSTVGATKLSGTIEITLSGDAPYIFDSYTGTKLFGGEKFTTAKCEDYQLVIDVRDLNSNPMPAGTKVQATNLTDVTVGEIFPASVPNTQGVSSHLIPIKPDKTKCEAGGNHTGAFSIKITPPLGVGAVYPFSLSYP